MHSKGTTDLAELDTHLIIRVDTPNSTLNVDLVLVHGYQSTKSSRVEFLEHDTVCRLVALEDLRLDQSGVGSGRSEFFTDFLFSLSKCEGSGGLVMAMEMCKWTYSG
jgi:urate oxidase